MAGATQWGPDPRAPAPSGALPPPPPHMTTLQKTPQVWSPVSVNTEVGPEGTRAGSGGLRKRVQLPEGVLSPLCGLRARVELQRPALKDAELGRPGLWGARRPPTPAQTTHLPGADHLPRDQGHPQRPLRLNPIPGLASEPLSSPMGNWGWGRVKQVCALDPAAPSLQCSPLGQPYPSFTHTLFKRLLVPCPVPGMGSLCPA